MRKHVAKERYSIDQVSAGMIAKKKWVSDVLKRISPKINKNGKLKVLDIGCAQGQVLAALHELGHIAYGVEPYKPAIQTANQLSKLLKFQFTIKEGTAESIPFDSNQFDCVLAFSVMEHVENLEVSLLEIYRVLKSGGVFWFNSASSMSPIQSEIGMFPFFGWYPDKMKRRIMKWAKINKPELVGHTKTPAIHWWTPNKAKIKLHEAGFNEIWDRWELENHDLHGGLRKYGLLLAKKNKFIRNIGDILVPGCSYAAKK
jgi:SAM-dependent methyltransferase